MKKCVFFLLLQAYAFKLAMAALTIKLTRYRCTDLYDMEENVDDEEVYLTYDGAQLENDECYLQFKNYRSFAKQICVKPLKLQLDCSTKVEYNRHFSRGFQDPEVQFSCENTSLNEYCEPAGTNRLYIIFRTSWLSAHDEVSLHIYLKDIPKEPDSSSSRSTTVIVVSVVVSVVFIIGVVVLVITCRVAKRRRLSRPSYPYQTTGGALITQTGQGNVTPAQPMTGYIPPQQPSFQPAIQGNYQMHPMQSTYPVTQQQGYSTGTGYIPVGQTENGRHSPSSFPPPSAPPLPSDSTDDPPPSYEMVSK